MVIFYSYVKLPEGNHCTNHHENRQRHGSGGSAWWTFGRPVGRRNGVRLHPPSFSCRRETAGGRGELNMLNGGAFNGGLMGFYGILLDFMGFYWILWDVMGFYGDLMVV